MSPFLDQDENPAEEFEVWFRACAHYWRNLWQTSNGDGCPFLGESSPSVGRGGAVGLAAPSVSRIASNQPRCRLDFLASGHDADFHFRQAASDNVTNGGCSFSVDARLFRRAF
jgi:hypothetical protein